MKAQKEIHRDRNRQRTLFKGGSTNKQTCKNVMGQGNSHHIMK